MSAHPRAITGSWFFKAFPLHNADVFARDDYPSYLSTLSYDESFTFKRLNPLDLSLTSQSRPAVRLGLLRRLFSHLRTRRKGLHLRAHFLQKFWLPVNRKMYLNLEILYL